MHQLRAALEQAGFTERLDTLTMLRFLRARKFNVEHAKQMYAASQEIVDEREMMLTQTWQVR